MRFKENVRILVKDSAVDIREWTPPIVPFHIGSLKIRLDAEDEPLVPLPVVTDLATTNESLGIRIQALGRKIEESSGIGKRIEIRVGISPAVTEVSSEIEPGPSEVTFRRCRRDLFHFLSARQCFWAGDNGQRQSGAGTK